MKILVVTQCYYPDNYNINDITKELVSRGHAIAVVTGLPDYTTSKIPKEYKWFHKRNETVDGVQVYRVPIIARHHGAVMRFINYASFVISGCLFCKFKKFDDFDSIYVWGATPVTMAIPAITLKKRYKKPLFFYCLDIWPESIKTFHIKEQSLLFRMVKRLCIWIYSNFDAVAVSSKPFLDYIARINGFPREKMFYLPQYGSDEYLNQDFTPEENGVVDFLYAGNIGTFQDVDCIIKAAEQLQKDLPYKIHIVGDGSMKAQYERDAAEKKLKDKIIFHGRVSYEEMPQYYRLADVCLLTLSGDTEIGNTLPLKLQTYMAAGKPIIGAINGAGQEVILESKCGLCGEAGDSKALAQNMKKFMEHPEKYRKCGENGRAYFKKNFGKGVHFETLECQLQGMNEQKTRADA